MDAQAPGEVAPTTFPLLLLETPAVVVDAVVDSPPPSDDGDHLRQLADEDLRAKIIKQVEYYFSDENFPNDKFLMKHVKKGKGYVSISLIASFRKMKRLVKDTSVIVDALKESSHLVMSPDGKNVRRKHPLQSKAAKASDSKSCTVVVENLPADHSEENIQRICGQVGRIKSLLIYDPHAAEEITQINKAEKMISGKLHALIRYETEETAEKAVATLNDETDWRNGLRVKLLQKRMGYVVGRKAKKGSDSDKAVHARLSGKEEDNNHYNAQYDDAPSDEEGVHISNEGNGRKGQNRSKGRKYHSNNAMGHGAASINEPSKPPPGPRMPDGTRGFVMGRGQPLVPSSA